MARIYETGHIVKQDYCESKNWYQIVAYRGEIFSMIKMADIFSKGICAEKNFVMTFSWLLTAEASAANALLRNEIINKQNDILPNLSKSDIEMAKDKSKEIMKKISVTPGYYYLS